MTKQAMSSAPPTAITIHVHIGSADAPDEDSPGFAVVSTKLII